MSVDIKKFYLNTPMARYEYMRLKIAELPQDFIDEYKLHDKTKQIVRVLGNPKGHVWVTSSRHPRAKTPRKTTEYERLPSERHLPRLLET